MHVRFISSLEELTPYAQAWDKLARGAPFRSWAWTSCWWRHYGQPPSGKEKLKISLFTLCVMDCDGALVGVAPFYRESSMLHGRVLRFLGSGEVCSEYPSVLCKLWMEDPVAEALADWLTRQQDRASTCSDPHRWDLMELTSVDAEDLAVKRLADHLARQGNTIHFRTGYNCWRFELPYNWDDYLARLSHSQRNKIRKKEREVLASGRVTLNSVTRIDELPKAMEILIDLHQRRFKTLGKPGCFASTKYTSFHREVAKQLLQNGQVQLDWLELDQKPVAAKYNFSGRGVIYSYQGGVNPSQLHESPGHLINIALIRRAIEQGYRTYDFLRGDEEYKLNWRAEPHGTLEVRVVPKRVAAHVRHSIWLGGLKAKQWIKAGLKRTGIET